MNAGYLKVMCLPDVVPFGLCRSGAALAWAGVRAEHLRGSEQSRVAEREGSEEVRGPSSPPHSSLVYSQD